MNLVQCVRNIHYRSFWAEKKNKNVFQIGARSYYFMLDRNGFVVFHPQLRPIVRPLELSQGYCSPKPRPLFKRSQSLQYTSPSTDRKYNKPFYNSMEFVELEIPQAKSAESMKAVSFSIFENKEIYDFISSSRCSSASSSGFLPVAFSLEMKLSTP